LSAGQYYKGQALPKRYRRRPPKACFYNARSLARGSKRLRYCEGYAMNLELPILFGHAWALDPADRVIDPTLEHPENYQFYGISMGDQFLTRERRYSGVLQNEFGWREESFRQFAPEWAAATLDPWIASLVIKS
jgi:hypothetical protein